jgi:hypothetical protein
MPTDRQELHAAVHSMLNDVVEQCFQHLMHHPQHSDHINRIIREASEEMNYQCLKIDAHSHRSNSKLLQEHYACISKDVHRRSLEMLSRLQRIQRNGQLSGGDEPPEDSSSLSQSF